MANCTGTDQGWGEMVPREGQAIPGWQGEFSQ